MNRIPNDSSGEPNPLRLLSPDDLRRRTSMKWRTHPADVLPLWVAEMDVPQAEPVVRAVTDALALGDTGYPAGTAYAEALAAFAAERWGWDALAVERTAIVPDVMLGVVEMLKLVTGPGDPVIVNPPVYPPFFQFVTHMDRRVVRAPLGADLRLDLGVLEEAFRRAVADGGRAAYLLCSPQNPTGTVHTAAELAAVAALADRHGVRVVADEIHAPLLLPQQATSAQSRRPARPLAAPAESPSTSSTRTSGRRTESTHRTPLLEGRTPPAAALAAGAGFVPYLSVPGGERGLSLMSASKGWNLPGLKAALAVAGPDAADDLARLPEEVGHGASHLGVIAHTAALRDGAPWLDALLAGLDDNRRLLAALLAERLPLIRYRPGQATYLAWLDCRALGLGDDPAAAFLDRGRVALNSGLPFGSGGTGHVRLNLGTSPELLTEAVRRMAEAVR